MIAVITVFTYTSSSPSFSTPTSGGGSWTAAGALQDSGASGGLNVYAAVYTRAATASDPGSTFTVNFSGTQGATNAFWWNAALASYTGANTVTPVDVYGGTGTVGAALSVT